MSVCLYSRYQATFKGSVIHGGLNHPWYSFDMAPSLDSSDHQGYEPCLGSGIPINLHGLHCYRKGAISNVQFELPVSSGNL